MSLDVIESVIVEEGRIHEVLVSAYSMLASNENTWCSMFNTKGYQRRRRHWKKLFRHAHILIDIEFKSIGIDWQGWRIVRKGSNRQWAVEQGVGQPYEIIKLDNK